MKIQSSIIQENLEIGEKVFPIKLNIVKMGDEIQKQRVELITLSKTKDVEKLGQAMIHLMEICFGKEATEYILEYYEKDYACMMLDILPFFTDVIYPRLDETRRRAIEATKKVKHG